MGEVLLFLGVLVFAAHLFSLIFSRKKIPDVLWLLIIGLVLGPLLKVVSPADLGKFGPVFSSITLVFILFEAGLDMSLKSLISSWKPIISVTFPNFFAAVTVITIFGIVALNFSLLSALTLGGVLGATSAAVIIPLVKHLNLSEDNKTVLVMESAITDVLCIVLVIAFIQSFQFNNLFVPKIIGNILSSFLMASFIGVVGGILWSSLLENIRKIQNSIFLTAAFVFILYGISESIGFSGAISALAFGITVSNTEYFQFAFLKKYQKNGMMKLAPVEHSFIAEITFLLKTCFFVYIGISIPFDNYLFLIYALILTFILLIVRLAVTKIVTHKTSSKVYDKTIISLMIPKGLAAAVLSAMPEQAGMPGGTEIKYITYGVIFISILLTSINILLVERLPWLNIFYRKFFGTKFESSKPENNFINSKEQTSVQEEEPDNTMGIS